MAGILGIYASSGLKVTNSYESIQTVSVGAGGSSSISFSSLPTKYTHLQIRSLALTSAGGITIRYNGDSGTNYTYHQLYCDGSTASANAGTAQTAGYIGFSNIAGSYPTVGVCDILDFQTNKYKVHRSLSGTDANGSGTLTYFSGLWLNTAAITSINILGTFAQYSSFALYGIKG